MPLYKCRATAYIDVIVEAEDAYEAADRANYIQDKDWIEHGEVTIFYEPDDMPEEVVVV